MSSGRDEGVSEIHTKHLTSSTWLMQGNGAGVRKCLRFALRNIISTVLSLLIVSLLRLDQDLDVWTQVWTSLRDGQILWQRQQMISMLQVK